MPAREFWHGEPRLAVAYREADAARRDDQLAAEWRCGFYVMEAIAAAMTNHSYPDAPVFARGRTRDEALHDHFAKVRDSLRSQFARANAMAARGVE